MTSPPTPDEIRRASFRSAFRGFDPGEVEEYLARVALSQEELETQRDRLATRLGEFAERDLQSEFETVGREVAAVLEAARQAAETMRERASDDAARWRSEAEAEAETMRREARSDAESLRTDAWAAGTEMIEQSQAEAARTSSVAERESLSVRGEAEREAIRLVSSARREAEDLVRNARMEAEKLVADSRAEYDEVIASAHRQAEAAQERTRALEQRRQELMTELEAVRETLASFEDELEDRRQGIGLTEPTEIPRRMVVADDAGEPHVKDWEEGHTVRVIRPGRPEAAPGSLEDTSTPTADDLAEEVARLHQARDLESPAAIDQEEPLEAPEEASPTPEDASPKPEDASPKPEDVVPGDLPVEKPVAPPEGAGPAPAVETHGEAESAQPPEVDDLFRRLRHPESSTSEDEAAQEQAATLPDPAVEASADEAGVAFETRERLLLPITNSALRTVKRTLTDAQNEALDRIRVSEGAWTPDEAFLGENLAEGIEELLTEAIEAGVVAAGEFGVEADLDAADVPRPEATDLLGELSLALEAALTQAGSGPRERSAAASRLFRGWRTDQAERRVRFVALAGYHGGLRMGLEVGGRDWQWVAHGRMCPQCRAASGAGDVVPPAHRDCDCIIVPV
ncbi:hypothetical protein BH23ACT5_BH23ACT5_13050 [soil metagenome]